MKIEEKFTLFKGRNSIMKIGKKGVFFRKIWANEVRFSTKKEKKMAQNS